MATRCRLRIHPLTCLPSCLYLSIPARLCRIRNPLDTSNFDNFDSCDVEAPPLPPGRAEKQPTWDLWEWIE